MAGLRCYYSKNRKKRFVWRTRRNAHGKFELWTEKDTSPSSDYSSNWVQVGKRIEFSRRSVAAEHARKRYLRTMELTPGQVARLKDRQSQIAGYERLAEQARERGRDDQAATYEIKAAALENMPPEQEQAQAEAVKAEERGARKAQRLSDEINHASEMVFSWQKKLKIAEGRVKKWERRLRTLERRKAASLPPNA